LEISKQELLLKSETAADYTYMLSEEMVHNMPRPVQEALAPFILYYA